MVTVRYWAAVKAAAGVPEEPVEAKTLADALAEVRTRHDQRFSDVLDRCSYLVDSAPVGGRDKTTVLLVDGSEVDCLPPFAGG